MWIHKRLETDVATDQLSMPSSESEQESSPTLWSSIDIGSNRDSNSQENLHSVSQKIENGEVIAVKLNPEPTKSVDACAIAFMCKVDVVWYRIGYVVRVSV